MRRRLQFHYASLALLAAPFLVSLFLPCCGRCAAAEKAGYLSQTYIDTVIQRAYENFSNAMLEAATQLSQEQAIEQARSVVERLKRLAREDVNSKYILWKVSELEYQIFLEEREIIQNKRTENVARLNELVDKFNAEIGRDRPDFVKLQGMVEQFAAVDQAKAREVQWLVSRRGAAVSRQVVTQINAALAKEDMEVVRSALDYCYANRGILAVTDVQVEEYNASLESRIKLSDQRRYIEEDMHTLQKCVGVSDLHGAWRTLGIIDRRLGNVGKELSAQQLRVYQAHRDRLVRAIASHEDSLVDANVAVYNTQGRSAAQDYMTTILRARGVSREKLAVVDQAMMGAAAMEQRDHNPELRKVFVDLADETTLDGGELLSDIGAKARRKAQERADSAEAARAEEEMARQEKWRKEHRHEARRQERERRKNARATQRDEAEVASKAQRGRHMAQEREKAELVLADKQRTKAGSMFGRTEQDANRQLAQQNIVLIYNLLEQGLVDVAYERFNLLQEPLREHLHPDAFATLEATVMAAYQESASR
jgi:hypothetical protein